MTDPRKTGISSITGKMVVIRHAMGTDLDRVREYLNQFGKADDLNDAEVVIAAEDERIIGFSLLKKGADAGCLSLFEDSRRRGIGSAILGHLMENAPLKKVYATRYASFFSHEGFERARNITGDRAKNRRTPCRLPLMERLSFAHAK